MNSCSSSPSEISRVLLSCRRKLRFCTASRIPLPAINTFTKANTVKIAKIAISVGCSTGTTLSPITMLNFTSGFSSRSSWKSHKILMLSRGRFLGTYKLIPECWHHHLTELHDIRSEQREFRHWDGRLKSDLALNWNACDWFNREG